MRKKPIKTVIIYSVMKDRETLSYHKNWRDAMTMCDDFISDDPQGNYHVVPKTISESVTR